jgi:phospholipid-translocating ATPase
MRLASLGLENVAFRGIQLKNTDYVYGTAIYTGPDTKMSQNSKMTSNKFSSIEVTMNKYLILFVIILLFEIILATSFKYTLGKDRPNLTASEVPWYLDKVPLESDFKTISQDTLSFLVLFNYIIPISLYVTLELQKFFGSLFFTWDLELYDEVTQQPAKCNSSDLNEELGQALEH